MGMGSIIKSLQKTDQGLKVKQQKKQQEKARVQQNIQKLNKRRSEMQLENPQQNLPIFDSISQFKPIEIQDNEEDFVEMLEMEEQNQENGSQVEIVENNTISARGNKANQGSRGGSIKKK